MPQNTSSSSGSAQKILVVDDEPNIRELLDVSLKFQGFDVCLAESGADALALADQENPDAFILDVMMPGMDGFTVLAKLREHGHTAPALFLTAKDDVRDTIHGLTIGADDYVTKPFSLEELITRLRVILRRVSQESEGETEEKVTGGILTYADLTLNEATHEITRAGHFIDASPTEFNVLAYLMENAEIVVSKTKILEAVWHYDFGGDGNVVESYISYLRKKIDRLTDKNGRPVLPLIHTVRGVGYVLRLPRDGGRELMSKN